ncbi:MAG: PHP domain-containing protein [Promethearchaeota archaeon]
MQPPKINLHIHSSYSDGKNSIEEIVKKALELDFKYIAITDHFSNTWKAKIIPTLNSVEKINSYVVEIRQIQEELICSKEKLLVLVGIEIDLESSLNSILSRINPNDFDLILFEHFNSHESIPFVSNLLDNWQKRYSKNNLKPLMGLAHCDPSYFLFDNYESLISFLRKRDLFFELNSSYSQYYSLKNLPFFKRLKHEEIMISISSDAHRLSNLSKIDNAFEMVEFYSLTSNLRRLMLKLKETRDFLFRQEFS